MTAGPREKTVYVRVEYVRAALLFNAVCTPHAATALDTSTLSLTLNQGGMGHTAASRPAPSRGSCRAGGRVHTPSRVASPVGRRHQLNPQGKAAPLTYTDCCQRQVGKAYGRTTYLSTTFQRVPRGTEGAVSVEGTLAGAAASLLMAALSLLGGQVRSGVLGDLGPP